MKKLWILVLLIFVLTSCETNSLNCKENENIAGVCIDTTKPDIYGIDDINYTLGTKIDILEGVTAIDDLDGDVTSNIITEGFANKNLEGSYLIKYKVKDNSGNETIKLRIITVVRELVLLDNMVVNGDFSNGLTGYGFFTLNNQADAFFEVLNEELKITIQSVDDSIWYAPRMDYQGLLYETGKEYHVSFRAKADADRMIHIQIGELLNFDPWFDDFRPNTDKVFLLTSEYSVIEFTFKMNNPTNPNGCILFEMGNINNGFENETVIYIDDLEIREIE